MNIHGYSRIILSANPAHATPEEHAFWELVSKRASDRGWKLVEIAARSIPGTTAGLAYCIPARLAELAQKMRQLPQSGTLDNLPWVGPSELLRMDRWEHRRWQLPAHDPAVYTGLCRLAHYIDSVYALLRPAVTLTTNKIDHGVALPRAAGLFYGSVTRMVERSPVDSIWLEPDGIFRESRIWQDWPRAMGSLNEHHRTAGARLVKYLAANPLGFRKNEASLSDPLSRLRSMPKPWVVVPMDNVLWTGWEQVDHPQGKLDHAIWPGPDEALAELRHHVRSLGGTLIVKNHPSCICITQERMPEGVVFAPDDLHKLIQVADAVVCFNTKVAFPALAAGKPVVTLAHNPVAASGVTHHAIEAKDVGPALRAALTEKSSAARIERFGEFMGWLELGLFYRCDEPNLGEPSHQSHRGPQRFADDLIDEAEHYHQTKLCVGPESLSAEFDTVGRLAEGHRLATYVHNRSAPPDAQANGTLRIGFDVNRLLNDADRFSGISRYTRELILAMQNRPDVSVIPIVSAMGNCSPGEQHAVAERLNASLATPPYFGTQTGHFAALGEKPWTLFHTPMGPLAGEQLTGQCPRIVTVHDCLHLKYPELFPKPEEIPAIQRVLGSIDPATDYVICVSEATRRDLLDCFPINAEHVTVIPEAADDLYHEASPQWAEHVLRSNGLEKGRFIVGLCQLDPRKNLPRLFKALAVAHAENKLDGMVFAGVCLKRSAEAIERELIAAGLPREAWRILTDVDDRAMAGLYASAAFSVYVPLYEGFGLPPLESMASGCPVLVSASSSLPEVVGEAGLYADPMQIGSIAQGLATLCGSASLRQTLSSTGRQRAKQFSWSRAAEETTRFYRWVLEREQLALSGQSPRTIRGEPLPPPVLQRAPRSPALQRAREWAGRIAHWYTTPAGLVLLAWVILLGAALGGVPAAFALLSGMPWTIAIALAAPGVLAAAALAGVLAYLPLRVMKDVYEDWLHPMAIGLKHEFMGIAAGEHNKLARRIDHEAENRANEIERIQLRSDEALNTLRNASSIQLGSLHTDLSGRLNAMQAYLLDITGKVAQISEVHDTLEQEVRSASEQMSEESRRTVSLLKQSASETVKLADRAREKLRLAAERTDERYQRLNEYAQTRIQSLSDQTLEVLRLVREEAKRHSADQQQSTKHMTEAREGVAKLRERLDQISRDLQAMRTTVQEADRNNLKRVRSERAARICVQAHAAKPAVPPSKLLVVVSVQRAGSTWLLDSLRSHPKAMLYPTAELYTGLGLKPMNRYPAGMVSRDPNALPIEIQPGVGEFAPRFDPPPALTDLFDNLEEYAIEKIHPDFYDFDASALAEGIERLREDRGIETSLLFRLRDPEMIFRSILRYKRRDPTWYEALREEDIAAFVEQSMKALLRLGRLVGGEVVEYEHHSREPVNTIRSIWQWMWPHADHDSLGQLSQWTAQTTRREHRISPSVFLGEQTSECEALEPIAQEHHDALMRCVDIQQEIREVLGTSPQSLNSQTKLHSSKSNRL